MNGVPVENHKPIQIDIPKIFYSDTTGSYLERCIGCDERLLDGDANYLIEKAFKSYQGLDSYSTIFEYAMCLPCVNRMHQTLSGESRVNIGAYFQKHAHASPRFVSSDQPPSDIRPWLEHCILTNESASQTSEFQIYGHCQGSRMIIDGYPFMISGKATDDLIGLISAKTLDQLQNFTDQLVGGPSEFADILKTRPTILL